MTLTQIAQMFSIATSCVVITAGLYGFLRFLKRWLGVKRQLQNRRPQPGE